MLTIDLNCDMGEGNGVVGHDAEIMDFVTSINIACGFHAGGPSVMRKTVSLASSKKIAIGAHPSFPDLQGFGRRNMNIGFEEVYDIVLYQVSALQGFARASGTKLNHVKPHGALYNMAARDSVLAAAISKSVYDFDKKLILFGLSGSCLIAEGKAIGLKTASEIFADRSYNDNGFLTDRNETGAFITDPESAAKRVLQMVRNGIVTSTNGKEISISAETVCIHADSEQALQFVKKIKRTLEENNVIIRHP